MSSTEDGGRDIGMVAIGTFLFSLFKELVVRFWVWVWRNRGEAMKTNSSQSTGFLVRVACG